MRAKIITTIALCAFLTGCGGRDAHPVLVSQYEDEGKSCELIKFEIHSIEEEMQRLLPETSKMGKNVALGAAGLLLWPAWLFMDFKNADQTEYEAYRQRYNHLTEIAFDKKCGIKKSSYPSVEEMKKAYEKQKNKGAQSDENN